MPRHDEHYLCWAALRRTAFHSISFHFRELHALTLQVDAMQAAARQERLHARMGTWQHPRHAVRVWHRPDQTNRMRRRPNTGVGSLITPCLAACLPSWLPACTPGLPSCLPACTPGFRTCPVLPFAPDGRAVLAQVCTCWPAQLHLHSVTVSPTHPHMRCAKPRASPARGRAGTAPCAQTALRRAAPRAAPPPRQPRSGPPSPLPAFSRKEGQLSLMRHHGCIYAWGGAEAGGALGREQGRQGCSRHNVADVSMSAVKLAGGRPHALQHEKRMLIEGGLYRAPM